MTISLYQTSVPVFRKALENLKGILDKAAAHAAARKIEESVLLNSRLFPDMFPLGRQVQIASDMVKGACARLAGVEIPKHEDTETTFAELKARLDKTLTFISTLKPAQIDGQEECEIVIPMNGTPLTFKGQSFLLYRALPNVHFHATTAYAILRHNGVELGKRDYLGNPE